jgi:hypothetical protein
MQSDDVNTDLRSAEYSGNGSGFYKVFMKYVTGVKDCGVKTNGNIPEGCYKYTLYKTEDALYQSLSRNRTIPDGWFNSGQLMLLDGSLFFFDDSPTSEGWIGVTIYVDINGIKNPPNLLGYDFFAFEVIDGIPYGMGDLKTACYSKNTEGCVVPGMKNTIQAINDTEYFKKIVKNYK